jgi:hypothetical protein
VVLMSISVPTPCGFGRPQVACSIMARLTETGCHREINARARN